MSALHMVPEEALLDELELELEAEIDIEIMPDDSDATPMLTSISLCTAGCTSRGGGSRCSWCC